MQYSNHQDRFWPSDLSLTQSHEPTNQEFETNQWQWQIICSFQGESVSRNSFFFERRGKWRLQDPITQLLFSPGRVFALIITLAPQIGIWSRRKRQLNIISPAKPVDSSWVALSATLVTFFSSARQVYNSNKRRWSKRARSLCHVFFPPFDTSTAGI
jgi:hypothetical protein